MQVILTSPSSFRPFPFRRFPNPLLKRVEPAEALVFLVLKTEHIEDQRGVACSLNSAVASLARFFKFEDAVGSPCEQAQRLPAEIHSRLRSNDKSLVKMYLAGDRR